MNRNNIGFYVIALGLVVATAGLLAGLVGIGDPDGFGSVQGTVLAAGLACAAAGALAALRITAGQPARSVLRTRELHVRRAAHQQHGGERNGQDRAAQPARVAHTA
jgi:hypothetical protein